MRAILALIVLILVGAASASATETINYSHDARARLIQVNRTSAVNNNAVTTYTCDKADNGRRKPRPERRSAPLSDHCRGREVS